MSIDEDVRDYMGWWMRGVNAELVDRVSNPLTPDNRARVAYAAAYAAYAAAYAAADAAYAADAAKEEFHAAALVCLSQLLCEAE